MIGRLLAVIIRQILEKDPDDVKALYWLGYIHVKQESFLEAMEYFQRAERIEPSNPEIKIAKAQAELKSRGSSLAWMTSSILAKATDGNAAEKESAAEMDDGHVRAGRTTISIDDRTIDVEGDVDTDLLSRFGISLH